MMLGSSSFIINLGTILFVACIFSIITAFGLFISNMKDLLSERKKKIKKNNQDIKKTKAILELPNNIVQNENNEINENIIYDNLQKDYIDFYRGLICNSHNKTINQIWSYSMEELERDHYYIQWLFPLKEKSKYNRKAPVLNDETIQYIKSNEDILFNIRISLTCMLIFYGYTRDPSCENLKYIKSSNYDERSNVWQKPYNYNYLRITRILKSLTMFGLEEEANAFYDVLIHSVDPNMIAYETLCYWKEAISNPNI